MDKKRLKEVLEEIENNPDAVDNDILVAGAICSILCYYDTEQECIDYIPASRIDELKQDSLKQFLKYMEEKSLFQTTQAPTHAEYSVIALEKMLDIDYEIAEMMLRSADSEEQKIIKSAYAKMSKL